MESKENTKSPQEVEIFEPIQFIKDLDISHDNKLKLAGCISAFITEYGNEKAKVSMCAALGL